VLWGLGRLTRRRQELGAELTERNESLRRVREERAALAVSSDRLRLAQEMDGLLDARLAELTALANSGAASHDPEAAREALATIERESRSTLVQMRELVGSMNGADMTLAPAPSVVHLEALLARTSGRLTVSGQARPLPASVELSAYRIVEHLVTLLDERPDAGVAVTVRFTPDALELLVRGPTGRPAEVRTAVARTREHAALHDGSLELTLQPGRADVRVWLPVALS